MAPTTKKALSSKENSLFKELLNLYETRQLKKGVKTADQILKKVPDHGETLCMKGLLLTHMDRREEGLELVKKGIRLDLTSHIVWHVYGLIQKGMKDYEGALKSYTQALRFDKENLNLLNDAANLQTQLRHYEALQDTRELLLKLRPNTRKNWISLAVAYHLNGNLQNAKKVLDNYVKIVKNVPDYDCEFSELTMYHIRILEELGEINEALTMLDNNAKSRVIVDRAAVMETRARLLTRLESPEAEEAWKALLERNPDCFTHYRDYFRSKGIELDTISDENRIAVLKLLDELAEIHTRSTTPRRLALTAAIGDDFKERAKEYLLSGFRKGIPSLFSDIKSLYKDSSKRQQIEEIVVELKDTYPADSEDVLSSPEGELESPTTLLWIMYFLAQHYSFLKRYPEALVLLDTAISHTPTLPELYTCKARTLKRAGDLIGAVKSIEEARKLDLQDRFLNTKSAKYHLRAGLPDEAQTLLGLFTKKDAASPGADLEEMQSLLYLTEEANAQHQLGKLGPALKKYIAIQKVFEEIYHDQYDFHFYALRRHTVNAYMKLLQWEDNLTFHPTRVHSIVEAVKIFVHVHDNPKLAVTSNANRTDAEKKAQKKAKKAALKNQEESKKTNANASTNEDKGLDAPTPKDDDPDGSRLLASEDGLEQAWKLLTPVVAKLDRVDVCVAFYDVSVRRKKYLQSAKALLAAHSLDPEDPDLHVRIVDFKQRATTFLSDLPQPIGTAISNALSTLAPGDLSPETFNSQYLQQKSTSARATLASAESLLVLKSPLEEVENTVFCLLAPETDTDIKTAAKAFQLLNSVDSKRADEFRAACDKRFELATIFKTQEEQAALRSRDSEDSEKNEEPAATATLNGH